MWERDKRTSKESLLPLAINKHWINKPIPPMKTGPSGAVWVLYAHIDTKIWRPRHSIFYSNLVRQTPHSAGRTPY